MPVTNYIWDVATDSCLMETDENDATTAVYTNEPGQFGPVISQRRNGESHFFHRDALGSVVNVTDAAENVTDSYVYKASGEIVASTGSTVSPFRWVGSLGYFYDLDLLQYYIRARHYSPVLARWLSKDPIGLDGNPYAYADNEPIARVDPSGTIWIVCRCKQFSYGRSPYPRIESVWTFCTGLPDTCCRKACVGSIYIGWRYPPGWTPGNANVKGNTEKLGDIRNWLKQCGCPTRKELLANRKILQPPQVAGLGNQIGGGEFQVDALPSAGPIGSGGAATCVVLVVECSNSVTAIHFTAGDDVSATFHKFHWGSTCQAVVCGGNEDLASTCLLRDVLNAADREAFKFKGVSKSSSCYWGPSGWVIEEGTKHKDEIE